MNTRLRLLRRERWGFSLVAIGVGIGFVGGIASQGKIPASIPGGIGSVILLIGILIVNTGGRCRHCRRSLMRSFIGARQMRFCPFCGASLDAPVEQNEQC